MILCFSCVPCLIQFWIPLMWVWLWYFIQHIHLCLCIFRWLWVIFFCLCKHINISGFIHLPMFHWFIVIWTCRLIHKLGLYTSSNIPSSASHQLWTWDFLQLIKYYRNPCFVFIFMILNHILWSRSILHLLIWMNNWLHLFLWKSSSVILPSPKIPSPYFMLYHLLW